MDNQL